MLLFFVAVFVVATVCFCLLWINTCAERDAYRDAVHWREHELTDQRECNRILKAKLGTIEQMASQQL